LKSILGGSWVLQDSSANVEHHRPVAANDGRERGFVTAPNERFNELLIGRMAVTSRHSLQAPEHLLKLMCRHKPSRCLGITAPMDAFALRICPRLAPSRRSLLLLPYRARKRSIFRHESVFPATRATSNARL
jgi:hypothetical protein